MSEYSWFKTFAVFSVLYAFFWVIPRRLNFICRRFGTLCLFHLHRQVGVEWRGWEMLGHLYGKIFSSKISWAICSNYFRAQHFSTWSFYTYLPMKMEQIQCSETSAYKIQTPGNYSEESIQHWEHGESLKSWIF